MTSKLPDLRRGQRRQDLFLLPGEPDGPLHRSQQPHQAGHGGVHRARAGVHQAARGGHCHGGRQAGMSTWRCQKWKILAYFSIVTSIEWSGKNGISGNSLWLQSINLNFFSQVTMIQAVNLSSQVKTKMMRSTDAESLLNRLVTAQWLKRTNRHEIRLAPR